MTSIRFYTLPTVFAKRFPRTGSTGADGFADPAAAGAPLANPDNFAAMVMDPPGNRENLPPEYLAEL